METNSITTITWEMFTYRNGSIRSFFTDTPERATMNLIHGYSASFLRSAVTNPPTRVTSKAGVLLREFNDTQVFGPMSMTEILTAAGVSLEDQNPQPWLEKSPSWRITGAVIIMRVTYSNLRQFEFPRVDEAYGRPQAHVTVEAVKSAWGFVGATQGLDPVTQEPVFISRSGIRVQFVFSGQVGQFQGIELIRRLVEGIVLLGVASFGTEVVARWILYQRDYNKMTSETVHWNKARALKHAHVFVNRIHGHGTPKPAHNSNAVAADDGLSRLGIGEDSDDQAVRASGTAGAEGPPV